jgi:hypothetical protein
MQAQTEKDEPATGDQPDPAVKARAHLFTVRLWKQEVADGPEYRGSVREVASGAFRNFRAWADLASFMIERMEESQNRATDRYAQDE